MLGTGITLAPPLTSAHAQGAATRGLGTGITFTPALTAAHAAGAAVSTPGTGLTLAAAAGQGARRGRGASSARVPTDFCRPSNGASSRAPARRSGPRRCCARRSPSPRSPSTARSSRRACTRPASAWNDMSLNGTKTSERTFLDPGFTSYDKTVLYTTDDVTGLIRQNASTRDRERDRVAARLRPVRQRDDLRRLGLVDRRVAREPDAADRPRRQLRGRHRAARQVRRHVEDQRRRPDPLRQPLPGRDLRRAQGDRRLERARLRRGALGDGAHGAPARPARCARRTSSARR